MSFWLRTCCRSGLASDPELVGRDPGGRRHRRQRLTASHQSPDGSGGRRRPRETVSSARAATSACPASWEEPLAAAEEHREDHQPVLVDEAVLDQRVRERGAAGDEDRAAVALLQLRDRCRDVALEQRRVVPVELRQGCRCDVFRHRVHLVRKVAFPRRPRLGEALVGDAPEQERLGLEYLVQLVLHLLRSDEVTHPAGVRVRRLAAGRLDDAV